MNKSRLAKLIIGFALAALVVLGIYSIWISSQQPPSAVLVATRGGSVIAPPPNNQVIVGSIPVDLTAGGTRSIVWHLKPGTCVDIYDPSLVWVATDCAGMFTDLRGRSPTYFASTRGESVEIIYTTW